MKLGIVISTQPTSFSALRYEENLEAAMREAAELGYDGVELAVRQPELLDVDKVRELLRKYRLAVPALGTGQAFVEEGLSFTAPDEATRRAAIERIKAHVLLAEQLDTHVIIGLIRGRGNGAAAKDADLRLLRLALGECLEYASHRKVKLFFEPLNRYESTLVNSLEEGAKLIGELGCGNLQLLADTFHMNIEERSLCASLARARPHLGHVHFADSNRQAPGSGHLGFSEIVDLLEQLGYSDYISMEMLPLPTPETAARRSMNHLKEIMANLV